MLPIFDGCGPFLRWTRSYDESGLREETKALVEEACREMEFVGVLGFSQVGFWVLIFPLISVGGDTMRN